ncbi:hypothetical protein CERSUDRAFT_110356 [Gelatoporia subvermispora B]|uniref:Uncharacterized protein n=1 Tax=Ceriporiopsis subvermispora (strain B) TaxID=914234 RepID=M2QXD9_CERS8|nr:hypothetical protein CERSUDRAFT_110356 [Gelatoporia subvermispora B]
MTSLEINDPTMDIPDTPSDRSEDSLVDDVAKLTIENAKSPGKTTTHEPNAPVRPLRVYSRGQLLALYKSPLVQPPDDMPALKDWFGDWNEQFANKKEAEGTTATSTARDRRFRRDPEDGEPPARPTFRSTLTQPSQMGNFRHQSLRTSERDKDRESERERERELRDKEGQERLRSLSDKYDRDRLAMTSSSTNLRTKDRDLAPHLATVPAHRLGQPAGLTATSRRNEGRDVPKRKNGESSDDWRRGAEPARAGRDDRPELSRRDRENRERPRSKVRDTSRTRRDASTSRRDRDRDERDRGRDRRVEGDRDEGRRDKDDPGRRDRLDWDDFYNRVQDRDEPPRDTKEAIREPDDDSRRWRDDGKRDERLAARRDRDRQWDRFDERDRERPSANDDRDGRPRRANGRERRGGAEEGRDREERRERDKEAEPAWMETYIPPTSGSGILGGKAVDGELDGIQAWKKGMKERERQEREQEGDSAVDIKVKVKCDAEEGTKPNPLTGVNNQLDEIQLFKLMMKREAEKKEAQISPNGHPTTSSFGESSSSHSLQDQSTPSQQARVDLLTEVPKVTTGDAPQKPPGIVDPSRAMASRPAQESSLPASASEKPSVAADGPQSLLSTLLSSASADSSLSRTLTQSSTPTLDTSSDRTRDSPMRTLPGPSGSSQSTAQIFETTSVDALGSPAPPQFNPPPGSRLLAFASRIPPQGTLVPPAKASSPLDQTFGHPVGGTLAVPTATRINPMLGGMGALHDAISGIPDAPFNSSARLTPSDSSRGLRSYTPTNAQYSAALEESSHINDMLRHSSVSAVERTSFGLPMDATPYQDMQGGLANASAFAAGTSIDISVGNTPGMSYPSAKGSRFVKFFEAKGRDMPTVGPRKPVQGAGFVNPNTRQDAMGLNTMGNHGGERTMEDLFAMLQNSSAQNLNRGSPQMNAPGRMAPGGGPFLHGHSELQTIQQHHIHPAQHLAQNNRLESLYDSRLDDRNFVPDGMVPGLRPAPPRSRSRESGRVLFNEQLDDPLHFNVQRLQQQQQQRNLEQMFPGPVPPGYTQQGGMMRGGGIPLQQSQFRGAPSPISNQNMLQGQRIPPGLANLGGRPPHDPSQYLSGAGGVPGAGIHSGLHNHNNPQAYNNLNAGGLPFAGNQQLRGPHGPQASLGAAMAGLGPSNSMDFRGANQAQLMGLGGGAGNAMGGMRSGGPGFGPQHVPAGQVPGGTHMGLRQQQQQQQHLPPHMMPHMLPHHLQQQGLPGGNTPGAQELIALLMGGHRD